MTFKKTDQSAYVADKPLSTAALRIAVDNILDALATMTPACGCAYDIRNPPILCGDGSQGTFNFSGESGIAFMVYPQFATNPTFKGYNIKVTAENPHPSLAVYIYSRIMSVEQFLAGNFGNSEDTQIFVAGATSTVDLIITTELPVQSTQPYIIMLSFISDMGGYELLYDPKMSGDETGLVQIWDDGNGISTAPDALWEGTEAQADNQIPYRLVFGRADTAGSYDPGAFDPDQGFELSSIFDGGFEGPPYLHQLKSFATASSRPMYYVYPGVANTIAAGATDAMARQQMGYIKLHAINIVEYTAPGITFDGQRSLVAHGQPASSNVIQGMLDRMNIVSSNLSPPLAFETSPSRFTDQATASPVSRRQSISPITTTWATVGEWVVGGPRLSFRTAEDTSTRSRNNYRIDAIVQWQMMHNSAAADLGAGLVFRAVVEDSGGDIIGDEIEVSMQITPTLTNRRGSVITTRADYLQGYLLGFLQYGDYIYRHDHNMRDHIPFSLVNSLQPYGLRARFISVVVQDSGWTDIVFGRRIRLEAKISSQQAYPPGVARMGQHSLVVWAAHVGFVRSPNPSEIGDS